MVFLRPGFHIVVIVAILSAIIADQVLQQLRLNGNANRNCCNSIGNQSVIVVEVKSGSTSTTITTIADKSTFNGNVRRRLSATEKCRQDHSHRIVFYILCNDESTAELKCNWRVAHGCCSCVLSHLPKIVGCVCEKKHAINLFPLPWFFANPKASSNTFWYCACNLRPNCAIYIQRFIVRNILSQRLRSQIVALAQV